MKKGFITKSYSLTVIVSLLFLISIASQGYGEVLGPGWFMGTAQPISPEDAEAYKESQQKETLAPSAITTEGITALAASATTVTPEIAELARALQYDPKLIYDYVHNYIDYVPYFGSLKGATLTLLDVSGNDFDQASLMIALLRESIGKRPDITIGIVQYVYGLMTIPGADLANWLGVDQNQTVISNVISSGGIPISTGYPLADGTTKFRRVWVKANINGTDYLFDPAFKSYQYTNKIDIGNATGYNRDELLTAAQAGSTIGTDYVQNLNEGNIGSKLATYSSNLVNTVRSQYPNNDVKEIISGRSIIQTNLTNYTTTLPFSTTVSSYWDEIPTDAAKTAKLTIQHLNCGSGIDINYTFNTPDLAGKRLTITYVGSNYQPELRMDGVLIDPGASATKTKCDLYIKINHPYAGSDGSYNYADQYTTYKIERGKSYAIVYNFGGVSDMLLQKRQEQLDIYLAQGLSQTSEEVLGETLNIMGITWLKELQMSKNILSSLAETVSISHHNIGLMAQESGYYIDVKLSIGSVLSKHNIDADRQAHFKAVSLIGSAFEHGILEQLMGSDNPGVSTMKLFQIANSTGRKVFLADSVNYASVQPQLQNYSSSDLTNFQTLVNNGYTLILPDNGQLVSVQWKGNGYISKKFGADGSMSMEMAIGGGYLGGYNSYNNVYVQPAPISYISYVNNTNTYTPVTTYQHISTVPKVTSNEPVDMAGGAYLYDSADLALGGDAPMGLTFSRSYNSSENREKRTLGYGWTHNYDIYLSLTSHAEPVLGRRQPVDAASTIAGFYVMLDLLKTQDNIVGWMTASLSSKWAVDQTIYNKVTNVDNAVTVHLGSKVMEFIKLPDGTYSAPPGITTQLIKNGNNTYTLKERFGTQIDFNTNNKIAQLKDADGNTMTFTYNTDGLQTVVDAFNRTLTLNYAGGKLNSVSDSTGRSVSYGYTGDDLTSYTDPELKIWGYGYDTEHRMTTLTNPLTITTATNVYDSIGRVKTQTVPRQGIGTVTYNFYFSGYRNMEEDPDNKTLIYYFDNSGRLKEFVNALGYSTKYEYDGQNHQTKVTNPRNYFTTLQYDGNNNLTKTTNALLKDTINTYDSQFRLTDTVDPLNHGSYFDYDTEHHLTLSKACSFTGTTCDPVIAGDGNEIKTSATYYANGLPKTATDARLTVATLTYDAYGNPYTAKAGAHLAVTTAYNTKGWLTSLTDQVGTTTTFDTYNNRGQLKLKTDPLLKTTGFEYDDAGRLWYKIDRNNNRTDYSYTPTSKIDTITYPDTSTVHFTYNQHDDLTGMQDPLGTTSYTYNADHSLNTVTDPNGFVITYNLYDEAGNLKELIYPGNKKVKYTYDELNRLKTVTIDWLNPKPVATYYYDDAGRLDYVVNFNGTITDYGYDNANRLTSLMNKKSDTTTLASYSFTLDGNGNRTQITQNEPMILTPSADTVSYTYNDKKNRLMTANTTGFSYNNEGQLATKDTTSYTFDYEHRLKTIGSTTTFYYDGSGKRLKAVRGAETTKYIYDAGGNLLAEANDSGVITSYYIHGAGLMAMVTPSNEVYTYHFNAVGSTIAMTDSSQTIVNKYSYDAFGKILNEQETIPQPFKFVGQFGVMTEPNGFYYMRARYYDPEVGRFVSEDPIGFGGGDVNLMAYVGNNPIIRIDPNGLTNWGITLEKVGQVMGKPIVKFAGGVIDKFLMAIDTSGNGAYYGSAVGGAIGAVAGSSMGPAGTVGVGLIGGYIGGAIGGLFDSPQAGQLNYGEDKMIRDWYNKNQNNNSWYNKKQSNNGMCNK